MGDRLRTTTLSREVQEEVVLVLETGFIQPFQCAVLDVDRVGEVADDDGGEGVAGESLLVQRAYGLRRRPILLGHLV
eukprot:CAMPEP_0175734976 /NCGR_PEP_ID=MMETSP0097-20121207/52666_1 /TAXON_ID=311494 /ORGANISM="Alexandrium monilatum, Strain CCMP3105" /LENGTH=76 /DNA_ID=CAMNT_0017043025 /DNA_START=42 /DNA_END=268 /DNA_ORIENTATION=-